MASALSSTVWIIEVTSSFQTENSVIRSGSLAYSARSTT